jgi:hypothetical protein
MDGTLPTTNFYARAISGDGESVGFDALGLSAQVPFRPEAYVSRVRRTSFHDIGPSIFRDDIIWLANRTITRGCNSDGTLFCPGAPVTRGEMAAFLVRALALAPPPATDPTPTTMGTNSRTTSKASPPPALLEAATATEPSSAQKT